MSRSKLTVIIISLASLIVAIIAGILIPMCIDRNEPDFRISLDPMQGSARQGGEGNTKISVSSVHGYEGKVLLSVGENS
jgi:hypothetical protein